MIWQDDEDGMADAEDILDVDALIAEQVREREKKRRVLTLMDSLSTVLHAIYHGSECFLRSLPGGSVRKITPIQT